MVGNDFHLSAGSPALDHGTDLVLPDVWNDLDGKRRPQGMFFDIGCYETAWTTDVEDTRMEKRFSVARIGSLLIFSGLSFGESAELFSATGILVGAGAVIETRTLMAGPYFYRILTKGGSGRIATGKVLLTGH
jgi:hypothetical protein